MNIEKLYQLFQKYPIISIDSRKNFKNSIFFAIKGENFDGNQFASDALKNGSKFAIVDNPKIAVNDKYILVKNSLETLQKLASYHRKMLNIPIIAITGSNGKTTTKELSSKILSKKYKVLYTKGNLNNHIGVPLTLLKLKKEDMAVIEMGANHPGEIKELCNITSPNYGLITNIGKAHLEGFGSIEKILDAKCELYSYLNNNNGTVFVKSENKKLLNKLTNFKGKIIQYGNSNVSICNAEITNSDLFLHLKLTDNQNHKTEIKSKLFGKYNLENILAAACLGIFFKISLEEIKDAIEDYSPENNRSQLIRTLKNNIIILDAYNANPTSMKEAISNFNEFKSANKTLILADMLELGRSSNKEHKELVNYINSLNIKEVILVGSKFAKIKNNYNFKLFNNNNNLIDYLKNNSFNNKTILIKGSRGMKLETIIDYL